MTNETFTEKPSTYSYCTLSDGRADVFIRIFDHEETDDDGNVSYICKCNEFRIEQSIVTEAMVAENPEKYLTYKIPEAITESERLAAVEAAILDLMEVSLDE